MADDTWCRSDAEIGEFEFRKALGHFATGVTIVTTRDEKQKACAMTVNAFSSVSLDPPLILYCLGRSAFHFHVFAEADAFAINMLNADQQSLSNRFAQEEDDDLADLRTETLSTGSPVIAKAPAALDCSTYARHEAGDHLIILGCVQAIKHGTMSDPLLYYRGNYRALKPCADD